MQIAWSASFKYAASRSAVEYTTTVCTPISRHARMMRSAISPRLAMRILENIGRGRHEGTKARRHEGVIVFSSLRASVPTCLRASLSFHSRLHEVQHGPVLDGLAVLDQDLGDRAGRLGVDDVEDLHRLDDADVGLLVDGTPDADERLLALLGGGVER